MTSNDVSTVPPQPVDPAPPSKGLFQRVSGALFSPGETFADIARRPDILGPLLLILVIGYISTALVAPRLDMNAIFEAQSEAMRKQSPNMSDEDVARAEKFVGGFTKVMTWIGPLIMLIWYVIVAGVLLMAVRLMGGEGGFKQAFSATLYAWMPLVLFSIISTIVILARGTFDPTTAATLVKSNPAFLVDMKEQPVLFSFLSSFDVFTIWTIALLVFGFSALSKLSRTKTAVIVVSLWVIMILIKVGFAAMGAAKAAAA
jgi:hypothetical protein